MKQIIFIALLLFGFVLNLEAQKYAVVSKKKFDTLSAGKIKALYLKKSLYINDQKIIPVNLTSRDKIRKSFEQHILKMNFNRLKSYWSKQHYLGHRPPITMKSVKSVKAFVKKVDGAIGYMQANEVDKDLNILYEWSD